MQKYNTVGVSVQYPFTAVPNQISRGGHGGSNMAVFCAVLSHGQCFASISTLAKEAGCNEKTARKSIKYWEDQGLFHVKHREGQTALISVVIHTMTNELEEPLPKQVSPPTKTGTPPLPKEPPKEDYIKKNPQEELVLTEKEKLSTSSIIPAVQTAQFFEEPNIRETVIAWMQERGTSEQAARQEIERFVLYWTEPSHSGKKQRWQLEPTFEIKRRLVTWLQRSSHRNQGRQVNAEPKGIRI